MMSIEITYDIPETFEYMDEEKINEFVEFILKSEDFSKEDIENVYLSLLITDNKTIKKVNSEYRGKDTATDVISFAYNETENIGPFNMLGDIVISDERVKEQANEYGHSIEREFYYVLCHGMLHLLGYDHMEEDEKKAMRKKEEGILEKFSYKRV